MDAVPNSNAGEPGVNEAQVDGSEVQVVKLRKKMLLARIAHEVYAWPPGELKYAGAPRLL